MSHGSLPPNETALVILVPEAEPVVGELRMLHDPAAGAGVPAHVTILYPFVPASAVTDTLRREIGELARDHSSFGYRFRFLDRFGDGTVYLVPEPAAAFRELTTAMVERWPEYPPYGGVHADVIPHLTVGEALGTRADTVQAAAAEALEHHGPVAGTATEIVLMTGNAHGLWSVDSRYSLRVAQ